jgi:tetratricopeptide (TPR) repeat protein
MGFPFGWCLMSDLGFMLKIKRRIVMKNMKLVSLVMVFGFVLTVISGCNKATAPEQKQASSQTPAVTENNEAAKIIADLEKQVAEKPSDIGIITKLAMAYKDNKEYAKAEQTIEKSLSIHKEGFALRVKADILLAQNKPGIIEAYQKAIEMLGNNNLEKSFAYFGMATYYLNQGNTAKATENAEKAYNLNKTDKLITEFLDNLK